MATWPCACTRKTSSLDLPPVPKSMKKTVARPWPTWSPSLIHHPRSGGHRDRATLAQLVMFNLLTAGVDAHAKNHGLVLSGNLVRLAPAYDLISAHGLWRRTGYVSRAQPPSAMGRCALTVGSQDET